ncbi:MAG: toxin-antitoxin system YwqK family antitoxin [Chitinophagales bacterium]
MKIMPFFNLQTALLFKTKIPRLFSPCFFALFCTLLFTACSTNESGSSSANKVDSRLITYQTDETTNKRLAYKDNQPFTGVVETFHSNGNTFTETAYKVGVKSGAWKIYHSNGKVYKTGQTENEVKQGIFYEWYPSGQKKYEQPYQNDKKHGKWFSWYENGQKWTERDFEDDTINGKVFVWDTDGTLAKEYTYVKGQLVSRQQHLLEE